MIQSFAQHAHLAFRTIDVSKWWTANLNPGTVNCPVVVNIDAYDVFSDEHRAVLDGSKDEAIQHYLDNYANLIEKWEGILKEKNVEKVEFSQDQLDAFKAKAAAPVREAWMAKMKEAGVPGEELYNLVIDTSKPNAVANFGFENGRTIKRPFF